MQTARAVYSNTADSAEELSFSQGDVLRVLEVDVGGLVGWWLCSLHGRTGIAPGNRLQFISPGGATSSSPSQARRSSDRGGRGTPEVCSAGVRSAASNLARQSSEREVLSRSGSFRQHGSNHTQQRDQLATYDAPQHLHAQNLQLYQHQQLQQQQQQQDYDVPPVRYQGGSPSCNRSNTPTQNLSPRPPTDGRTATEAAQGDDTSSCNYDSPASLRHEYDTLRNIQEMNRALSEIQSTGLKVDTTASMQNYDSPSTLKRGATVNGCQQNYHSPQSLLASQQQNYDSPQSLLANHEQNYDSPQSLRNSQNSPSGSLYNLQSCRAQYQSCGSPRQAGEDMYDSPMSHVRNCNSPCTLKRATDPQIYDSPHTLTRGGARSLAHCGEERRSDSPSSSSLSSSRPLKGNGVDDQRGLSGQFGVRSPLCASPKEHISGVRQNCHMGEYDVPANLVGGLLSENGMRCGSGIGSALSMSNRSSVLSSIGSRSSACSGSSPSTSARSSTEVSRDVCELSPSLAAQDLSHVVQRSSPTGRGVSNVEGVNVSGEMGQMCRSGGVYQQQQHQQSGSIYDNRDSYLDDYSVPRSDSSIDSGISVQSGSNDHQAHDVTTNGMKADQLMGGEYDTPSQLLFPASSASSHNSGSVNTVAGFQTPNGNSGLYSVPASHRKPPAVKPKPKSKPPEKTTPQGRPLPSPPGSTTVAADMSKPLVGLGQGERVRLTGSGEGNGSKADISVIVSDSASEWNDDCDYVTIANDAELEVKRKVEEATSGNHFNARLASEAFNSRVNRPVDVIEGKNLWEVPPNESSRPQISAAQKNAGKYTFQVPQVDKPGNSIGNSGFVVGNSNNSGNSAGGLSNKFKERLDAVKKATDMTGDAPSGRVAANVEPVIEFYASQADVILLEVEGAAGEFFNCEGIGSTDVGSFARRGRNVILAAHKLVYVSDAMARLGTLSCEEGGYTELEGVGEIVQAANTLCESLKSAVVATRSAALLFPDATSRQRAEDCILSAVAECAELTDVIHANATHLLVG